MFNIVKWTKHFRLVFKTHIVKEKFMNIRRANFEDAKSLVEFNQAMARETEGKMLDAQILQSGVEAVLNDESKGFYAVAESNNKIVGGLMVTSEWSDWRDNWFWWIQSVYILPEFRGQKIYSLLYEFVKHKAQDKGDVCGFRLYVERENFNAQKVYEKCGMEASHYLMYEEMIK
jgi:ribosomal protein S18 acetylase RimI-like enzyme